jgi:tight adherence protein B
VIGFLGKRRIKAFLNLFPDAIDLIVRALKSGLPVSEAIMNAAQEIDDPVGAEFRTIESGMRMGRDLDSLLWDIAKRVDTPEWRFFIISLSVQRETGGNLGETLGNLSDLLRRRRAMRQKARAMASEARASTMILGSLPIIVTAILMLTSPHYIMTLFTDVRGLIMCGIALGMLVTGIGIMVRMAKFEI